VSLTAGTILHNTKTPLTQWFWAAYLMTTDKRGISALLLQRQLGLSRYETAWMLLHKLRRAMVNAAREPLYGDVEVDDTWIGGPQPGIKGSRQLKDRHAVPVLVAVETRGDRSGRIRMVVLPNFTATTMTAILKRHVAPGSTIYTDGLGGFAGLAAAGFRHIALKQPLRRALRKGARSVVPLADRAIGNLQHWLIGTYHGRQPRATSGVPGRVRLSPQPAEAAHGGLSNAPWPRHRAQADAISSNPGRTRYAHAAGGQLIPTYSALLKQPDKQEPL
jgi:transposase-like protein